MDSALVTVERPRPTLSATSAAVIPFSASNWDRTAWVEGGNAGASEDDWAFSAGTDVAGVFFLGMADLVSAKRK
ncbi:MAG: hypothetical protein AUG49_26405 [Catenulispora sp. 13_1_20CM_3_70_7]|nr:MAG: hypothetical protein AUG49_26405 [Catenulispora sp. 13_1_20CM_3_70_7]